MYYLDLYSLYKRTTKEQRIGVRTKLNRNKMMEYKLKLQHNSCFYCGTEITMAGHLDHILPVYHGGSNKRSNLVASCRSCNLLKGTGVIEITNPYTIKDYLKLQEAKRKYMVKKRKGLASSRYIPKRVQLYSVYHAKHFKYIKTLI